MYTLVSYGGDTWPAVARRAVERDAEVPAVEREQFVVGRDRVPCVLPVLSGDERSSGDRDPPGRRYERAHRVLCEVGVR